MPRWRWWVHLVLIVGYVVWAGLLGLVSGDDAAADVAPVLTSTTGGLLLVSAVTLVLFAAVFGGAWLASRATADALLLRWRRGAWPIAWGLGYSIALRLGIGVVAIAVALGVMALGGLSSAEIGELVRDNRPDVEALVDVEVLRDDPAYFWLMATVVSFVVAGLREELWRAAFLAGVCALWPRRFASRGAQIGAMAIAALIFGFGHALQGPMAVGTTALLGFGFGVIMVLHRSIWPAVLAHGFFNATTFVLIPLVQDELQRWQDALPG